jgi:hypothetical protein
MEVIKEKREKSKGRVEAGKLLALRKWGKRFKGSIFPTENGKHRVTLSIDGKDYSFMGEERLEVLNKAFTKIREIN